MGREQTLANEQELVRWFFDQMRGLIREELRAVQQGDEWVDQRHSPDLGSRRHCKAVRERMAAHADGAKKIGDRYLLTTSALCEELEKIGNAPVTLRKAKPVDPDEAGAERVRNLLAASAATSPMRRAKAGGK